MSLKSLTQYFNQAYDKQTDLSKDYYLETIKLGGYNESDARDFVSHAFTPRDGLYFENIGTIKSFSFDNMPGAISQQEMVSRFVHTYNYDNKQFIIDVERNSVEQAMNTYKQNYVDNMLSNNTTPPYPNFAPGSLRSTNTNVLNIFSTSTQDSDIRLGLGRNSFLYASIMANNLISFRLPGSTHRQAGRFIGIDRDGALAASKFDDKLLGIYFIVEVRHTFSDGEYFNDLHCIKTYNTFKTSNTNDTGTISKSL
jgi:hypothetical protein